MQTPVNINKDKIDSDIFCLLYINIILVWERAFKTKKTGFSVRTKYFKSFKSENSLDIYIAKNSDDIKNIIKTNRLNDSKNNFFVYTSNNSQAYDLFRHLRNSVAHGNYKKQKIGKYNFLVVQDLCRNKLTMYGQVKMVSLEGLIYALYQTKT